MQLMQHSKSNQDMPIYLRLEFDVHMQFLVHTCLQLVLLQKRKKTFAASIESDELH